MNLWCNLPLYKINRINFKSLIYLRHILEDRMCPSSIAAWFSKRGYSVSVCHQQKIRRAEYSLNIPVINDGFSRDLFFEWLGVFTIGGNL